MSIHIRALVIGMMGPVVTAIGMAWDLLEHAGTAEGELKEFTLRHIFFAPEHLMISAGVLLTLLCVPVAIEVALARPEERNDRPASTAAGVSELVTGKMLEADR